MLRSRVLVGDGSRRTWVLCQIVGISGSDVALNLEQCVGEECLHLFNLRFLGFSEEAKAGAKFGARCVVLGGLRTGVGFELQGEVLISGTLIGTELVEFVG